MSHSSELANQAASLDWNIIAAAAATFLGTLIITVWGWFTGRKKLQEKLNQALPPEGGVQSAVILDNLTIREATMVNREVRDHLLIHHRSLDANCRSTEANTGAMEDLLEEIKLLRQEMSKLS